MPAAVATGAKFNGQAKNKKIVFNDDGEAQEKPNKPKHNKKPAANKEQNGKPFVNGKGQQKKSQKIKFGDDVEAEEVQNKKKPQKIKFGDDDEVVEVQSQKKPHQISEKKPQRIKFDEDGEQKEQVTESEHDTDNDEELEEKLGRTKKRNKYQGNTEDEDAQKKWYHVVSWDWNTLTSYT